MKQRLHAFKLDGEGKRQFWNGKPIKPGDKKVPPFLTPALFSVKLPRDYTSLAPAIFSRNLHHEPYSLCLDDDRCIGNHNH
jgi:hypothetical protein